MPLLTIDTVLPSGQFPTTHSHLLALHSQHKLTARLLAQQMTRSTYKRHLVVLAYITCIFVLGTLYIVSVAGMTQLAFIDDRNFPGRISDFEKTMFSVPIGEFGHVCFVLTEWLSEWLMVSAFISPPLHACGVIRLVFQFLHRICLHPSISQSLEFLRLSKSQRPNRSPRPLPEHTLSCHI